MNPEAYELVIRAVLALVFLPSGIGKLFRRAQFVSAVREYALLPRAVERPLAAVLPLLEITIGVSFIIGSGVQYSALISTMLVVSFSVAIVITLRRGRILNCHCYGILGSGKIGQGTVARNALLVLLSIALLAMARHDPPLIHWRFPTLKRDLHILSTMDSWLPSLMLALFSILVMSMIERVVRLWEMSSIWVERQAKQAGAGDPV